ncbi:MAG: HEAT repeat domain-containing protein [Planctomycetes bacterium]|nr:HEAT repeat domain-containing protein [Planctomycetota bacterium]
MVRPHYAEALLIGLLVQWAALAFAEEAEDIGRFLDENREKAVQEALVSLKAGGATDQWNAFWSLTEKDAMGDLVEPYSTWLAEHGPNLSREQWAIAGLAAGRLKVTAAGPHLLRWLEAAQDPLAREATLYALGELREKQARAAVQALLQDPSEWVRFLAAEALEKIDGKWKPPKPTWPGLQGLRVLVVSRSPEHGLDAREHALWAKLLREAFQGAFTGCAVKWFFPGSVGGWNLGGGVEQAAAFFDFRDDGQPNLHLCLFNGLVVNETSPFFLWRMFQYARRGGRVILHGDSVFYGRNQRELLGVTITGGEILGKVINVFPWHRGPWESLLQENAENRPLFPSVDGLTAGFKSLWLGYKPIEKGGCLLVTRERVRPLAIIRSATQNPGRGGELPVPFLTEDEPTGLVFWKPIFEGLAAGPSLLPASIDWADEPLKLPMPRAASPFRLQLAVSWRSLEGEVSAQVTLAGPRGDLVASHTRKLVGKPGDRVRDAVVLPIDPLAEAGDYRLAFSVSAPGGQTLHAFSRTLSVLGRFDLVLNAPPLLPSEGEEVAVRFHVRDHGRGALQGGRLRLTLVDEDWEGPLVTWEREWSGPADKEGMEEFRVPAPRLPPGQFTLLGRVGDAAGRTFAQAETPIARQEWFDFHRDFLWSQWGNMKKEEPEFRAIGLNTAYHWGSWVRSRGYPYEYAVTNPPFYPRGAWLGDFYLGRGSAQLEEDRRQWLRLGEESSRNARAVANNFIEEVGIGEDTGAAKQYLIFLQSLYRTLSRLNERFKANIAAWDELPLARAQSPDLFGEHDVWFGYDFYGTLMQVRAHWLREMNPYLNLQPGMGAGGWGGSWLDSMHMRGYAKDPMTFFTLFRSRQMSSYGRRPFTWLVGMEGQNRFPPQSRVVWSAIAAGGRHILNYAPGDHLGHRLLNGDGSLTDAGQAYQAVIRSVRPNEPVLCFLQNRVTPDILSLESGYRWGADRDPVCDALFRLGLQHEETRTVRSPKLILHTAGEVRSGEEVEAIRKAVEAGAVLLITPDGDPAVARGFGIQVPDPKARGEARRFDLTPLASELPVASGLSILGLGGPARGLEAGRTLRQTDGLIHGRIGQGLLIYLNFVSSYAGGSDALPFDLDAWAVLMDGLLKRCGVPVPHRVVDAAGRMDGRFIPYTLDTEDGSQRYLLLQANDLLEGSLSAWNIEERAKNAFARLQLEKPRTLQSAESPIVLRWTQQQPADALLWVKRRIEAEAGNAHSALLVSLDGQTAGGLRAWHGAGQSLWEAGPALSLQPGEHALSLAGNGRAVSVEDVLVLPAEITTRILLHEPSIRASYDVGRRQKVPVQSMKGIRFIEVSLRPGDGTLLSLIEEEQGRLLLSPVTGKPRAGQRLGIEVLYTLPDGRPTSKAHTVVAQLVKSNGEPVTQHPAKDVLSGGRAVLDLWAAEAYPTGLHQLVVDDLTTGDTVRLPLEIRPPGAASVGLEASWQLEDIPLLGGRARGKVTLKNHGNAPAALQALEVQTGCPGVAVALEPSVSVAPGAEQVLPLTLFLPAEAPEGRTLLRLASKGAPLPEMDGFELRIPPPVELEVSPLPDMRIPDAMFFDLHGRLRNRTAQILDVKIITQMPASAFLDGRPQPRLRLEPGTWTAFSLPLLISRQQARQARSLRDLATPVHIETQENVRLATRRATLLTNAWDTTPPVLGSIARNAMLSVQVLNAADRPQSADLALQPFVGLSITEPRKSAQIPPGETLTLTWPVRWDGGRMDDGIHAVPYSITAPAPAAAVVGEALIELKTERRWWIARRPLFQAEVSQPDLDLAQESAADPWELPHGLFESAEPPRGWKPNLLSLSLPWSEVRPAPDANMIGMAATRIPSDEAHKVKARIAWLTTSGLWQAGMPAAAGAGKENAQSEKFLGQVWLNGDLIFDNRPKDQLDAIMADMALKPHGELKAGMNNLVVQCAFVSFAKGGKLGTRAGGGKPGTLYLWLEDLATSKPLRLTFDMETVARGP